MRRVRDLLIGLMLCLAAAPAGAAEAESCRAVRFAEIGWTDIAATTAIASRLLDGLGYQPATRMLTVPDAYRALSAGEVDVFLGNWMPSMQADRRPYVENGSVEIVGVNLEGAKFTLAVPGDLYEAGLRSFADIARFREPLKGRIHGLEPDNDGNRLVLRMIRDGTFGLQGFELVESSEAQMLRRVEEAIAAREPVVFLAWEPHPMNARLELKYLSGGDAVFGPAFGGASVHTNTRRGYGAQCPNAGAFIRNLTFTLDLENRVMASILSEGRSPAEAAQAWLAANPSAWAAWLDNVTAFDGRPGLDAARKSLGL